MDCVIREYREGDRSAFIRLMEELQDHLIEIDTLKKLRRLPEYGEEYAKQALSNVEKNRGKIFLAEQDGVVIGCVIGTMEEQNCLPSEFVPTIQGRIVELIVSSSVRSKGIGAELMKKAEEYLKGEGCELLRVAAMSANERARAFYEKQGYEDRMVELVKKL